jgi:hypothetical protein
MAKKKSIVPLHEETPDFDALFMNDEFCYDDINSTVNNIFDITKHHMSIALDLTKLIVAQNQQNKSEEAIIAIFKNVLTNVHDASPLKRMMEEM